MNTRYADLFCTNSSDSLLLDAWLKERLADSPVEMNDSEDMGETEDKQRLGDVAAKSYDADIAPGQIRILSYRFVKDHQKIPYVAVLDRWVGDYWLVAPFSPYSFPATPGEMVTGRSQMFTRVLQVWNARTLQASLLRYSFLGDSLDETVRQEALALFRHRLSGTSLPETFSALVGSPVLLDMDPRQEYLSEFADQYAPITQAVQEEEERLWFREKLMETCIRMQQAVRLRDAAIAAAELPTAETLVYSLEGAELEVLCDPKTGEIEFSMWNETGDMSEVYDGACVVNDKREIIGILEKGRLRVSANSFPSGGFALVNSEAEEIPLVPKSDGK